MWRVILSAVQKNVSGEICDFYRSLRGADVGEGYFHIICEAEGELDFIGPFYEDDGVGRAEVVEADAFEIGTCFESIGVDVADIEPAVIFVDEDEGGAGDGAGVVFCAATCGDAFYEMCFSTAERAGDGEYFATGKLLSDGTAEGYGFSGGVCNGFEFHIFSMIMDSLLRGNDNRRGNGSRV